MTEFSHGAFVAELRRRRKTIPQDLYDDLMASLEAGLAGKPAPVADAFLPPWLAEAKRHLGLKEVPGKQHNSTILSWLAKLPGGAWIKDDETPWCGTFVAWCMVSAGYQPPKDWFRAKEWLNFGKTSLPRVGAIAVFGREAGGHVGFCVGESADNLYILGGNQSNAVNITPIAKSRLIGMRWPASLALSEVRLPPMVGGTVSRDEA
jgi:uncharacterized protein (TIGR02594 family)